MTECLGASSLNGVGNCEVSTHRALSPEQRKLHSGFRQAEQEHMNQTLLVPMDVTLRKKSPFQSSQPWQADL